jgi:hypothetical protein
MLIGAVLPFYILLSFSAVLCSFHHLAEGGMKEGHHHASEKSDRNQASDSPLDFCKYAQSISPVIHSADAESRVSFQPVAQTLLCNPFIFSKENISGVFLRGPPILINL